MIKSCITDPLAASRVLPTLSFIVYLTQLLWKCWQYCGTRAQQSFNLQETAFRLIGNFLTLPSLVCTRGGSIHIVYLNLLPTIELALQGIKLKRGLRP